MLEDAAKFRNPQRLLEGGCKFGLTEVIRCNLSQGLLQAHADLSESSQSRFSGCGATQDC